MMNKKAVIFLILFLLSFLVCVFLFFDRIKVPYFNGIYKDIKVDLIFKNQPPKLYFNDIEENNFLKIDNNHYLFSNKKNKLIKKITFDSVENIESLAVYNGNNVQFFNEIPNEISIDNTKNLLDKLTIIILSFFYNFEFYFVSYIFLFLFLYNYKTYLKPRSIAVLLLLLGFILRLAQLNHIPFWDDEIYILTHTNKWFEAFQDPGNPPLYFILFKIYRTIFKNPEMYRFSSVILGILFNIGFYFYLKSFLGSKRSLLGLFIASINIVLIYFSQEIRCYMLLMLLATVTSFLLFRFNKKTKIFYFISTLAMLYTHFYAAFYVFYNFIVGLILFRKKKKLKSFLWVNLIAFIGFIPLLIYKKQSLISDFNTWIKAPNWHDLLSVNDIFVGHFIVGIIFVGFLIFTYKKVDKKIEKLFLNYNLFLIASVVILSVLFSYLIKPIFYYKYFYITYPSYLALVVVIALNLLKLKIKLKNVLVCLILLLFTINSKLSYQNLFCNHNLYIDYIKHDIDKTKNNYIFLSDTVEGYETFKVNDAKMIYLPVNKGISALELKDLDLSKDNSVFYVLNLYLSEDIYKIAKKIVLFKTPSGVFCKIEL